MRDPATDQDDVDAAVDTHTKDIGAVTDFPFNSSIPGAAIDAMPPTDDEDAPNEKPKHKNKLLFLCYVLVATTYGGFEMLPASLFSSLSVQLAESELRISYILLSRTISYTVCQGHVHSSKF